MEQGSREMTEQREEAEAEEKDLNCIREVLTERSGMKLLPARSDISGQKSCY